MSRDDLMYVGTRGNSSHDYVYLQHDGAPLPLLFTPREINTARWRYVQNHEAINSEEATDVEQDFTEYYNDDEVY